MACGRGRKGAVFLAISSAKKMNLTAAFALPIHILQERKNKLMLNQTLSYEEVCG